MNKKHTRRSAIKLGGAAALGIAAFPSILSAQTGSLSGIKKRGYLLYGFNGEKPYNYMDAEGNLTGSEIDLARAIAKNIGIDEVQGVAMNFDSFIPAIMAGRIDTCLPIFVKRLHHLVNGWPQFVKWLLNVGICLTIVATCC